MCVVFLKSVWVVSVLLFISVCSFKTEEVVLGGCAQVVVLVPSDISFPHFFQQVPPTVDARGENFFPES